MLLVATNVEIAPGRQASDVDDAEVVGGAGLAEGDAGDDEDAAAALGGSVEAPQQYWRSQPSQYRQLFGATTTGQR